MTNICGINFAPLNVPFERRLQTLGPLTWFCIMVILPIISFPVYFYLIFYTQYYWILILYGVYIIYEHNLCDTSTKRSEWFRKSSIWYYFCNYFPLKLVKVEECKLDNTKNYLFCSYPHGLLCASGFGNFATDRTGCDKLFPGFTITPLSLAAHYITPFLREIVLALGTSSVSKRDMNRILSDRRGGKIAVLIVGGAAEAYYSYPGSYKIVLNKRKGFIKIALQNGVSVVPVLNFGETDLYDQVKTEEGSSMRYLQDAIKNIFGVAPVFPIGRGFFQYSFGLLPRRRPVTTVVGKPVDLPKIEKPTEDEINIYHEKFREALLDLFNTEKHKYLPDPKNTVLEIT